MAFTFEGAAVFAELVLAASLVLGIFCSASIGFPDLVFLGGRASTLVASAFFASTGAALTGVVLAGFFGDSCFLAGAAFFSTFVAVLAGGGELCFGSSTSSESDASYSSTFG